MLDVCGLPAAISACDSMLPAGKLLQREGRAVRDIGGVVCLLSVGSVFSMDSQQQEKVLHEGGFQWPPFARPPYQGGSEVTEREPGKRGRNVLSTRPWKMELGVNPSTTSKNMLEWTP